MNVIAYTERKYITTTQRIINITELNLGEHYKILSGKITKTKFGNTLLLELKNCILPHQRGLQKCKLHVYNYLKDRIFSLV